MVGGSVGEVVGVVVDVVVMIGVDIIAFVVWWVVDNVDDWDVVEECSGGQLLQISLILPSFT